MALDNLKAIMVGTVLGIAIILCGVFIIGKFYSSDTSLDSAGQIDEFNHTLALSQNITVAVQSMDNSISSNEGGAFGWIDALFKSSFTGLRTVKTSMEFTGVAAKESAKIFGIEEAIPIIAVILLIVTIIILIAIYEAITRQ